MASTIVTNPYLISIANVRFSNSNDISNYFKTKTTADFITWFNANIALKNNWAAIKMASDADAINRFNSLWNQIPIIFSSPSINLLQFVSLMSIVNNETGGKIKPVTELIGNSGNPGLSYAFNKIAGIKKSYNTLSSNKTAYDLFHDVNYIAQHGALALGNVLKNSTDVRWKGELYLQGTDSSLDPLKTGFIQEADFYKFRGRGFIQTTTRGNYSQLVDFIQKYNGANTIIKLYQNKWKGKSPDTVATISTNNDWDDLFQNTDLIIPAFAINIHSRSSGNYLNKITLQSGVDANIKQMGRNISGSGTYADLFLNRVLQIL
ncbi:MAG: hypothetical protein ACXVEB_18055, partial [Bacteroidia bacterium]